MFAIHTDNMIARIAAWVKQYQRDLWIGLCLILVGWSAYNIGYIKGADAPRTYTKKVVLSQANLAMPATPTAGAGEQEVPVHTDLRVVTSKTSTSKKYHYSWCASGQKIKPANQKWFDTAQAAQAAGYTLAGNCH
jgi:hypothetical protein